MRSHFKDHTEAVVEILRQNGYPDITEKTVKNLEKAIFDNSDIFFDAVVYDGDEHGRLMGFDYITPHSSPTKNPVPIRIIKVLPNVRFEFRFKLTEHTVDDFDFKVQDMLDLFKNLILLFGVGAKTNVGYGIFSDVISNNPQQGNSSQKNSTANKNKKNKSDKPKFIEENIPEWKKKLMSW